MVALNDIAVRRRIQMAKIAPQRGKRIKNWTISPPLATPVAAATLRAIPDIGENNTPKNNLRLKK
jgi:hypothetical protein